MNIKILLYIVLLFSLLNFADGQEPSVDSLRKILPQKSGREKAVIQLEIAKTYENIPPQERIELAGEALKFAESENDERMTGDAIKSIGIGYYYSGNFKKAGEYFRMALQIFRKTSDDKNINAMLNNLALVEQVFDNYFGALNYYKQALENEKKIKDSSGMSKALINISTVYIEWGMYDVAMDNIEQSRIISEKIHDKRRMYSIYINLAKIAVMKAIKYDGDDNPYFALPNTDYPLNKDSASRYFNISQDYANKALNFDQKLKTKNDDTGIYNLIAHIMLYRGKIDSALYYCDKAIKLADSTGNPSHLIQAYYVMAVSHFQQNKIDLAQTYFKKTYDIALQQKDVSFIAASVDYLREIAIKNNDYMETAKYANELIKWKDTIFSVNNSMVFAELRGKVDYERQQKEILEKQSRILKLEQENSKQSNMRNLLILLSIMLLLISVAYYSRYQIKSKMHEKLEQTNEELSAANTKLKESEDNLRTANATKDKFLSILSHDLKNSVGSFKNITELLSQNYHELDDDEKMDFLNIMQASSKNLYTMLENLLSWARSQSGRIRVRFDSFPILDIINAEINFVSLQASSKNIKIETNNNQNLYVFADYNMISTVVRNLITNAVKFTPNYGNIYIETKEIEDYVQIKVRDTGVGIPFDKHNKLFQIDETFSTRGTSNETGTGLGLVLCKEFIDRNNGTITFESIPDHGATFIVNLPKTSLHDILKKIV